MCVWTISKRGKVYGDNDVLVCKANKNVIRASVKWWPVDALKLTEIK